MKTKNHSKSSIILCLILFGCVSGPPVRNKPNAPRPWVSFSQEIEVTNQPGKRFAWAIDQKGNAHFIAEMLDSRELQYVVINQNGILGKSVMDKISDIPWYAINKKHYMDVAFDSSGDLHLIRDGEHFVYRKNMWEEQPIIPCLKFARGSKDLICGYIAGGKEFDAPGRLDWYVVAGYGGGLIWPWYSHPDKLVIVKKEGNGWFKPAVVDPETKQDIVDYSMAVDETGNLYVLYTRGRHGIMGLSYIFIEKNILETFLDNPLESRPEDRIIKIFGENVAERDGGSLLSQAGTIPLSPIAVDPKSGTALFSNYSPKRLYLVKDGKYMKAIDIELSPDAFITPAPAGDDQFHVLIYGRSGFAHDHNYYLICRERECSAPIYLDEKYHYGLVSDGYGNSLLLLISKDRRLSAKWIKVKE